VLKPALLPNISWNPTCNWWSIAGLNYLPRSKRRFWRWFGRA